MVNFGRLNENYRFIYFCHKKKILIEVQHVTRFCIFVIQRECMTEHNGKMPDLEANKSKLNLTMHLSWFNKIYFMISNESIIQTTCHTNQLSDGNFSLSFRRFFICKSNKTTVSLIVCIVVFFLLEFLCLFIFISLSTLMHHFSNKLSEFTQYFFSICLLTFFLPASAIFHFVFFIIKPLHFYV